MSLTTLDLAYTALAIVGLWIAFRAIGNLVHRRLVARLTIIDDLPQLGKTTTGASKVQGCAVICGGSISGLLAARVCSDHFSEVVVVEPEALFDSNGEVLPMDVRRKRILQYTALHGFQPINLQVVRALYPTFDEEVKALGARVQKTEYNTHVAGVQIPSPEGNTEETVYISRAAYETVVRKLTKQSCSNIKFLNGMVLGVKPSAYDPSKIGSVQVRLNGSENAARTINVPSALLVDCTGHTLSAGPKWLERAGFGVPLDGEELGPDQLHIRDIRQSYDPKMHYTSHSFRVRPEVQELLPIPGGYKRAGFLYSYFSDPRMDNKTVLLTWSDPDKLSLAIGGWDLQERPKTVEDLKHFLRNLNGIEPIPEWIFETLDLVADDEVPDWEVDVRVPPLSYNRFDLAVNLPTNFAAIGDSVMRVNPSFGQGCAKAALGAATLDSVLRKILGQQQKQQACGDDEELDGWLPSSFGPEFWNSHTARTASIWYSTKAMDYSYASTIPVRGEDLSYGTFGRWYRDQLIELCTRDKQVAEIAWRANMFVGCPTDTFLPSVIAKVTKAWVRREAPRFVWSQWANAKKRFVSEM